MDMTVINSQLRNHQVTWQGTVYHVIDDKDAGDLVEIESPEGFDYAVRLADGQGGYDLEQGKPITIQFVLRKAPVENDRYAAFEGDQGVILPINAPTSAAATPAAAAPAAAMPAAATSAAAAATSAAATSAAPTNEADQAGAIRTKTPRS
jgi:hypothetical protein